ncbi:MAG: ABC transporter ATP-binding protein [Ruminococcaceae bacterium]|nr:ABC transporter ATP-binding protein [Oscillospiraceae bacterium]
MKQILKTVWQMDRRNFLLILLLNIGVALTSSISIVLLIPMLDLLEVSIGDSGALGILLQPFAGMNYLERAVAIIAVFIVLMLLRALLNSFATVRQNAYLERYEMGMRKDVYQAIGSASWETLSERSGAELIQLISLQCRQARFCLQWTIGLIASAFSALLQLVIALWMSLPVTIMALVVGASFLFLFRPFLKKSKEYGQKAVEVNRELHRETQNQLSSIKEIRAYGAEDHHRKLFAQISQKYYDISLRTTQLRVIPQLCYSVAAAVLIGIAFVFSVLILDTGTAQLMVLVYIFSRLWPVFSSWQGQLQNIQAYVPAYETVQASICNLTKGQREPQSRDGSVNFTQQITFDKVGFTYKSGSEEVLKDLCFTLPRGSVTALVGPSGAGKSTTADLLLGLLQPTEGRILVDDVALDSQNLGAWRKRIGYIPQEPLILNATIRENLLRFHPEAGEEEMISALKRSLAWPFIEKLPNGLDTVLGDNGVRLSGGERQRIVLARVLMGDPSLIILDEATSALDYESENFIRQTIRSLREDTTVLIIAHRMATIRGADRAIVLLNGRIEEQGSLQELLQKQDSYLTKMVSVE